MKFINNLWSLIVSKKLSSILKVLLIWNLIHTTFMVNNIYIILSNLIYTYWSGQSLKLIKTNLPFQAKCISHFGFFMHKERRNLWNSPLNWILYRKCNELFYKYSLRPTIVSHTGQAIFFTILSETGTA